MTDDFIQIKIDIGDLKSNVSAIKTDLTDMKHSITNAIDRISNSMAVLATVSEKLNHNDEVHREINLKIEDIIETQLEQHERLSSLQSSHEACLNTRKQLEDSKKNSPFNKAKDKLVEYLFLIIVTLVIFVLFSHFSDYIEYMNTKNAKQTTVPVQQIQSE
jgi:DNA repair ATPase RecN